MKKFFCIFTLIATMIAFASCEKKPAPGETPGDETPGDETPAFTLAKTSWIYMVPDDADGGKMAITFLDDKACFLVNGDKEGWWWPEDDGYRVGEYSFDNEKMEGMAFDAYTLAISEGKLYVAGLYVMDQVDFFTKPE